MKVYFKGKNGELFPNYFPISAIEIQDIIDRVDKVTEDDVLTFRIADYDNNGVPFRLCGKEFTADIYKLNVLAEKIHSLERPEYSAFCGLLEAYPPKDIDDVLQMCYGAGSIPIYPCNNCYELGEIVIENDFMPELSELSEEIIDFLDQEKIGMSFMEKNGGIIELGYYCEVGDYQPPEIEFTINKKQGSFFRVLASPNGEKKFAQWYELPTDSNTLTKLYDMKCFGIKSSLPMINEMHDMSYIFQLNDVANRLKECSEEDFIKLKAIMEAENTQNISAVDHYSKLLDNYILDRSVATLDEFGHKYLERLLPENINLKNIDLSSFGEKMLMRSGGNITSYGALSGEGMELYPDRNNTQEQEDDEDMDEDEDLSMGGLCQ